MRMIPLGALEAQCRERELVSPLLAMGTCTGGSFQGDLAISGVILGRGQALHLQRMDRTSEFVFETFVDETLTANQVTPIEGRCDDDDAIMTVSGWPRMSF